MSNIFCLGKDLTEDLIWTQCKFASFLKVFSIRPSSSYFKKDERLKVFVLPLLSHTILVTILILRVLYNYCLHTHDSIQLRWFEQKSEHQYYTAFISA